MGNKDGALLGIDENEEAITYIDKALEFYKNKPPRVELDPNEVMTLMNKGVPLVGLGQYQQALT